jgi:hypothetical protein
MRKLIFLSILFVAFGLLLTCSKKQSQTGTSELKAPDPTTGIREADFTWEKQAGTNVTFYFQPVDSLRSIAPAVTNRITIVYQTICTYLMYSQPEPIVFYCYKDMETLKKYTGRDAAFFLGNTFYYGYGPTYGREIAEFVVGKLPGGPSRYAFVRDGILWLLDHSGRNYHHACNNFLQDKSLLGVQVLANDTTYGREEGIQKMVEAASLCAYIMNEYGTEKFMQIYHSQSDFPTALKQAIGIDLKKLEAGWESFLPEHTNEKEMEREKAAASGGRS